MASSQHRPATKVTLSPAGYAKERLKRVENLEAQLASLPSKKGDEQASKLRMQLCEILSDILLTDPLSSLQHDALGRLWRGCFYGPIGILRQRISREKKKKDSHSIGKLQNSLGHFIQEAITLYDYLISQYHVKLLPNHVASLTPGSQQSSQTFSQAESQQSQAISHDTAGVVPGLFRMYIHLGDLYRYEGKYKEAQHNYGNASRLSPGRGNPYNQIAVVAQLKDAAAPLNAVALYWYARSLLTTDEPFEISKANLSRLFQSNREWFSKQQAPDILKPSNGSSGREMPKSQRSIASRHFLSQFVDLHYSFFQGFAGGNEQRPTHEAVVAQIEGALTPLSVLLRNSAFGDPLLCKMVAICAFSEAYRPEKSDKVDAITTQEFARSFTLAFGTCLAERAAVGLAKIKDQPEKMGNPGKAPSSVRLLLPLLLVCEYVENTWIDIGRDNGSFSPDTLEFFEKTVDTFWQRCVDVLNMLTDLRGPLDLSNDIWKNSRLKEFDTLVGFSPFQNFLEDTMSSSREDGYASVDEAVEVLELTSTQESHQTSTQDSVTGGTNSVEEYKVKAARLLAFGDRMADDSTTAAGRCFGLTSNGCYLWKKEQAGEQAFDTHMMDVDSNDTQPPFAGKGGDDVLVYSVPEGGGPALLVPGMLLQNLAMGGVAGDAAETKPRSNSEGSFQAPTVPFGAAVPAQTSPGSTLQQPTAPAASIMPPPGFGVGRLVGMPLVSSLPQGHVPMAQVHMSMGANLAMSGNAPSVPVAATEYNAAMPPGFGQGYSPFMTQYQVQQNYQPTFANSMQLFGGPEALKTSNPFAAASMPTIDADGNMPMMDLGFGGGGMLSGNGASFFNPGASGVAESSWIGSGLLHSLFEDSGDKTTKNPFAT